MTDRHAGYVVVLDRDIRDDDAQATIAAIGQIKGVASVEPIVADPGSIIAEVRAKREIGEKVLRALGYLPPSPTTP